VTTAIYEAGYNSASRLYERADAHLGMTPTTYKRGGLGMDIGYTVVDSPLGRLLVAATQRGVCFVSLGDDDAKLQMALAHDYPAASLHRDDAGLGVWVEVILAYLRGQQPNINLPLDVQATAFQWRVWEALRAIPAGATRSYGDIARSLNNPKAARAVGHACATNPVALVIPCHRAVRENGSLGGYRWGMDIKEALLTQEKALAQSEGLA
jgi:AraC family transcriptional regulator, regulatory protein of adaptative response / methylated-DNA-[protein]-cysteine methyltransferase